MDNALARHVALAAYKSRQELNNMAELIQNHGSSSEAGELRAAAALVDMKIQALLNLAFENRPGLQRDLVEKTAKYGKPL
jgi:hypothetical protein